MRPKYTQEKDLGMKLKSKVGKINLEGCHGRFRGRQINSSEFQINFTDGIQFWCGWQGSRLYRKHKEREKNLTSIFLRDVRCLISVIVCLYICWYVFVHMSVGVLCVSSQYGIKINKEKK